MLITVTKNQRGPGGGKEQAYGPRGLETGWVTWYGGFTSTNSSPRATWDRAKEPGVKGSTNVGNEALEIQDERRPSRSAWSCHPHTEARPVLSPEGSAYQPQVLPCRPRVTSLGLSTLMTLQPFTFPLPYLVSLKRCVYALVRGSLLGDVLLVE